ncbi:hypothetical protein QFZ94_003362 [Paraburkholderia sp. JPY465]|uniref:hypothetical protein n=1 Tax=Paraburkholderia sp. JPY465 TaxID=3042285 RepID=UPI003D1FD93B
MSDANLFGNVEELRAAMLRLECRCDETASELRSRIAAQERAIPTLGRFASGIEGRRYREASEMVVAVTAGSMTADRLELLLLRLECEFVKRKASANRSRSNARFDPFYEVFDGLVKGRRCRDAKDAHQKAAAVAPPPHPMPSVSRRRYGTLRKKMAVC